MRARTHTHAASVREDNSEATGTVFDCGNLFLDSITWFWDKAVSVNDWAKENHLRQCAKILITYFQILGSFSMFEIVWPDIAYQVEENW
jgi:hypothetical protein